MNSLLDLTGHFLYIALRILLLPLFILLDIFLGVLLAIRFFNRQVGQWKSRPRQGQLPYQLGFKKRPAFLRTKFSVQVNGH
ncbi:MAG: hypothetical protein ACXVMS_03025 [Flavisolibacter sp.]